MRQLHSIIFVLLFGILAFLFIATLDYTFIYREQDQLFLFDHTFFDAFICKMGGMGEYIETFIIQFFYIPYVGELILALILSSIYLFATLISRKITKADDPLFIALIPAIYLLIQYESIAFDIYHSTNLIIVLLFSYALSYLRKWKLIIVGILIIGALSYLLGWICILAAAIIIGASTLSTYLFKSLKWSFKWPFRTVIILIYISVGTICFIKNYSLKSKLLTITEISLQKGDWQQALNCSQRYSSKNQLMCYYQNIALANSGKLATDLFKYQQECGAKSLFFIVDNTAAQYSKIGHYVYEHIGHINEATHWANESFVTTGVTASNLINLIKYNLLLDKPKVAMRYIRTLEKSLFYQDEVELYKDMINKGEKPNLYVSIEKDTSIRFTNTLNFQAEIETVLKSNPDNKKASIYYLSYLLLDKQLEKFANELTRYYNSNIKENEISKTYLEALLVYAQYNKESPLNHLLTPEIEKQYIEYHDLKSQNKWELLKQKYSTSYWFYLDDFNNIYNRLQ